MTVEMVARMQAWLTEEYRWDFEGKKTSRYRQIGNAFPPPVARQVGLSIARALKKDVKSSTIPAPRRVHDEVYRLLRDRDEALTVERIQQLLGDTMTIEKIKQRIEALGRDFTVEVKSRGGRQTYRLGEWKAFRGQDDHERHLAFAEAKTRAKVS